jgi:hypothetical protein
LKSKLNGLGLRLNKGVEISFSAMTNGTTFFGSYINVDRYSLNSIFNHNLSFFLFALNVFLAQESPKFNQKFLKNVLNFMVILFTILPKYNF